MPRPIRRGDLYVADGFNSMSISVMRVARDGSWADIEVNEGQWTKRQPLTDGAFPFPVRLIDSRDDG